MTVGTAEPSVLIVEDNPDLVLSLQDLLEHEGYQVAVTGTCAEAMAQAHRRHFNAVLLDLGLPDGDGLDVLHALQSLDPTLPIIIVTASTATGKTVGSLSKGAFAYLTKPYNGDELRAILRRAIGVKALAVQVEHSRHALIESEYRFRSLVESASDAIVVSDEHGYIASWNRAASLMFGHEPHEIIGKPLTILMPMRYREAHEMGLERMRTTGQSKVIGHVVAMHALHKTGREFPIELSLAAWTARDGMFFSGIIRNMSERTRVETVIRESKERLNLALRAGKLGTWEWNPRTGSVLWSDNAEELFHLAPGSLASTFDAFLDLIHSDDRIPVAKRMVAASLAGKEYADEYRILWPDGVVRWVTSTGQAFRSGHGKEFRMIGTIQCITQRKEAELALQENQVLFTQLTECITDVFWMTDPNKQHILYISPGYESIWGRSCASLKASPRSWLNAIHPEYRDKVLRDATTNQVTGEYNVEYRIIRPDGTIRWIWDRAFPIRDTQGAVYRIAGLAEDITERKQTEAAAHTTDERR